MASPARLIGLLLLAALLGWALWEASWRPELPAPPEAVAGADAVAGVPPEAITPLGDYVVTLQRPLFFPGRRAPDAVSDDAPASAGPTPAARGGSPLPSLSAVIEEGDQRSALLSMPGQATSTRVRPGESLGDWRLLRIEDDSVTLERNGQREQVPLRRFGDAPRPQIRPAAPQRAPRFSRPPPGGDDERTPE